MSLCPEMLNLFWREFSTACGEFTPEGIHEIEDYENLLFDINTELKFDNFVWKFITSCPDNISLSHLERIVFFMSRHLNWVHVGKDWDFEIVYNMIVSFMNYAIRLEKLDSLNGVMGF